MLLLLRRNWKEFVEEEKWKQVVKILLKLLMFVFAPIVVQYDLDDKTLLNDELISIALRP